MRRKKNLVVIETPKSPRAEEYKMLRTNIEFSLVDKEKKIIMITSAMPSEGKSTTSANLAVTLQQLGKRVILVDCDQRKPSIHKKFNLSNTQGLSDYLARNKKIEDVINNTTLEGLEILTSGTIPPNPSELLSSKKMENAILKLKETYDYIILDTPPIGLVTDAQILSKHVDGTLLVIESNNVEKNIIIKAKNTLEQVNANIIGVVLNKVEVKSKDEYYYAYEEGRKSKKRGFFRLSRKRRKK